MCKSTKFFLYDGTNALFFVFFNFIVYLCTIENLTRLWK
jgi:hypothetical protein